MEESYMLKFKDFMELLNIHFRIIQSYNLTSRNYGTSEKIYQSEAHVIQEIGDTPGLSLNELADRTYRTKSSMSMMISKLSDKGLVKRGRDDEDNRKYTLTLTQKGKQIYRFHNELDRNNYSRILEKMIQNDEINEDDIVVANKIVLSLIKVLNVELGNERTDV